MRQFRAEFEMLRQAFGHTAFAFAYATGPAAMVATHLMLRGRINSPVRIASMLTAGITVGSGTYLTVLKGTIQKSVDQRIFQKIFPRCTTKTICLMGCSYELSTEEKVENLRYAVQGLWSEETKLSEFPISPAIEPPVVNSSEIEPK